MESQDEGRKEVRKEERHGYVLIKWSERKRGYDNLTTLFVRRRLD